MAGVIKWYNKNMEKKITSKILFIDDDEFLVDLYKIKFTEAGFEVYTLENAGGDFVQKVADIKPDLISLDIIMPIIDGFGVVELLKKDERTKNIPIIGFDNLGGKETVDKIIKLGAVDYLLKAMLTPSEVIRIYTDFLTNPKEYKPQYQKYQYKKDNQISY